MSTKRSNKDLWTMAVRNLARRPRRSVLSALAIGVAALTMTMMLSLIAGIKADLAGNIHRYSTGDVLIEDRGLFKAGARPLSLAVPDAPVLAQQLRAVPGVVSVAPRITTGASVFQDGDAVFFSLMGQNFDTDPMGLQDFLLPGGSLPLAGERQGLISSVLAEELGLKVGDTLTAVTQTVRGSSNGMTVTVTGIVHPNLGTFQVPWLFVTLETAQRLVKLADGATGLLVTAQPGSDASALARALQPLTEAHRESLAARPWFETSALWGWMTYMDLIYGFIGLVFFALASTVIINTMLMVVLERSKEIGMLAALGMGDRQIRNLFLAESAVLSGIGAVGGAALGCLLAVVLGVTGIDYTEAMKGVNMGVSNVIRPQLEVWNPIAVTVVACGVAVAFTLVPLARLRKLKIVEALRGEL